MTDGRATASLAVQRRREGRREEWNEQTKLAALLREYLDPARTYWTALENKPLSAMSGVFQRRRGVKAGIPDVVVIFRQPSGGVFIVFVELKSRRGVASEAQKQARAEMLPAGAVWWMARSANAAMMALHLSDVPFLKPCQLQPLELWEGPFADPHQRLPQEPTVAAERKATLRAWRERQRVRKAEKVGDGA
jgi:hypothetical protein